MCLYVRVCRFQFTAFHNTILWKGLGNEVNADFISTRPCVRICSATNLGSSNDATGRGRVPWGEPGRSGREKVQVRIVSEPRNASLALS